VPVAVGDKFHTAGLDRGNTIAVHPFANRNLHVSLDRRHPLSPVAGSPEAQP
jgi:hypothetical protein